MKSFKTSFTVCMQNLRKWSSDYRALIVLVLLIIVYNYHASWFLNFSVNVEGDTGIAPWIYVFAFTGWQFVKIMTFAPLLLLFSNAPFIDDNQPYIISRCTRRSWCFGQILYIVLGSAIYVIVSVIMSVLMIAGNMELTTGWGKVITTAGKVKSIAGATSTGVSGDILYYFSPLIAMFYTMLLVWLACTFIGLLIYVINSVSGKTGYGIFAGGFLLIFDYVQQIIASGQRDFEWLSFISPISWCSINLIDITGKRQLPDIYFVFGGYIIMILILVAIALNVSKKQQIDVIGAV